jgi:DUF917 family protein
MIFNRTLAEYLSLGGLLLGCGGGGNTEQGCKAYEAAFEIAEKNGSQVELITLEELAQRHPEGGAIVTISGVGSPASPTAYTPPEYYPRLMELLKKQVSDDIIGFVACEVGASNSFEPFVPAAILGVPVIDAPCDGRAHPLGLMGSLGLEKKGMPVVQCAVGGRKGENGTAGRYVEISLSGTVESCSALVRNASAQAGGFVMVARNPVDIKWLEDNAAAGAFAQTIELGRAWKEMLDADLPAHEMAESIAVMLSGRMLGTGKLRNYSCITENALDHGQFDICCGSNTYNLSFFNEYMTLEDQDGNRLGTFPDGIIVIGSDRQSYTSAMLARAAADGSASEMEFSIILTSYENLKIPTGLRYRGGYRTCENIIHKDMISELDGGGFFLD